ncbi:hypothetical protein LDENG_00091570 [Lucifuga dentata]|nr:hypothetical protein LDENG_00091570 [Lucifuga dentata]
MGSCSSTRNPSGGHRSFRKPGPAARLLPPTATRVLRLLEPHGAAALRVAPWERRTRRGDSLLGNTQKHADSFCPQSDSAAWRTELLRMK